jgi:uncharacterized protein YbbK (DUF523 family)
MYIVSACLAGLNTRYDGTNSLEERVKRLLKEGKAIAVCPEQLGGLGTPRPPVEFATGDGGAVLDGDAGAEGRDGMDYSASLVRGARETLRVALLYGVKGAVLKDGSPSCGVTYVHSGGRKVAGRGVTAELLRRNGIEVKSVDSL